MKNFISTVKAPVAIMLAHKGIIHFLFLSSHKNKVVMSRKTVMIVKGLVSQIANPFSMLIRFSAINKVICLS